MTLGSLAEDGWTRAALGSDLLSLLGFGAEHILPWSDVAFGRVGAAQRQE